MKENNSFDIYKEALWNIKPDIVNKIRRIIVELSEGMITTKEISARVSSIVDDKYSRKEVHILISKLLDISKINRIRYAVTSVSNLEWNNKNEPIINT